MSPPFDVEEPQAAAARLLDEGDPPAVWREAGLAGGQRPVESRHRRHAAAAVHEDELLGQVRLDPARGVGQEPRRRHGELHRARVRDRSSRVEGLAHTIESRDGGPRQLEPDGVKGRSHEHGRWHAALLLSRRARDRLLVEGKAAQGSSRARVRLPLALRSQDRG